MGESSSGGVPVGRDPAWEESWLGWIPIGSPVWEESQLGRIPDGRSSVGGILWAGSRFGGIPVGRSYGVVPGGKDPGREGSRSGGIPVGRNPGRKGSRLAICSSMGGNLWEESCMGGIPMAP